MKVKAIINITDFKELESELIVLSVKETQEQFKTINDRLEDWLLISGTISTEAKNTIRVYEKDNQIALVHLTYLS